jgi:uncharacterized protein YdgA (DUF945 family)
VKKIVIGAIAALVLAYPLLSWLMGFVVERRINEPLEQIRTTTPYVQIVQSTFRRGWFSSEQDLTLEMFRNLPGSAPGTAMPAVLAPFQLTLRSVIRHGPLCGLTCVGVAHTETHVEFSGEGQELLRSVFAAAEPMHLETRMGFFGGGSASISSPPIQDAALKNGAHVSWGGLSLKNLFAAGYGSYALNGSAPNTVYAGADGKRIEVGNLALDAHAHRVLRTLYAGDALLTVARIGFSSPAAGGTITVNDLMVSTQNSASGGYMTILSKTSTGAVATAPLTLTNMHFDFSLRHLDMESLEAMRVTMREINQGTLVPADQRAAKMLEAIKEPGISFLSHLPEFGIDRVSIATAGGEARVGGVVRMPGVVPADFASGTDPKALIQKLDADLDCVLDDGFLASLPGGGAQFAAQLRALADQGLLSHENGKFQTKIAFHQGKASFNGKPFPPPAPAAPAAPPAPHR